MIPRDRLFRWLEWGFFPAYIVATNLVNASSVLIEYDRMGRSIDAWKPFVWEFSSGALFLALIPFLVMIDRRRPFQAETWPSTLSMHAALTVPFSVIHVAGMVAIRRVVYQALGGTYDFGNIPVEMLYEYRKDALSYVLILAAVYAYRHVRFHYSGAGGELVAGKKGGAGRPSRLLIRGTKSERFLDMNEIEWVEAAGNYVNIHAREGRFFLRGTLSQVEEKLSPDRFVRVHRSNIVNLDQVREILPNPSGDGLIVLKSGGHVPLSRRYRSRLKPLEF